MAQSVTAVPYVSGFTQPVGIFNAGDDRLFIVQQGGLIRIIENETIVNQPFLNLSSQISTGGERGLLGLAFHPDYADNGYFYVNYTASGSGNTVISRYTVSSNNPNQADASSGVILMNIVQPFTNHNGGHIEFGPDGYLYIGMGDGGSGGDPQNYSQNNLSLLGKMLRIDVNHESGYAIPPDNPHFADNMVLDEIWAFGLRNPWKFSFDRWTGDLWIGDVGQNAWEEINFTKAGTSGGLNYGWRCYEGNAAYNLSGCLASSNYTFPVHVYANNSSNGCSVTGGIVYRGNYYGALYGNYIYGDFCSGNIWMLSPEENGEFSNMHVGSVPVFNLSAFGEDQCGEIYLAGRGNGIIYRLEESSSCEPAANIHYQNLKLCATEDIITLSAGCDASDLSFQWYFNGEIISGENDNTISTSEPGFYQVEVSLNNCTALSDSIAVQFFTASYLNEPDDLYCTNPDEWVLFEPFTYPELGVFTIDGDTIEVPFYPGSLGQGQYWLTFTATQEDDCIAMDSILLNVSDICTNSTVNNIEGVKLIVLYPNPAKNQTQLAFESDRSQNLNLELLNSMGQIVHKEKVMALPGKNSIELNFNVNAGLYIVRLVYETESIHLRLNLIE